MSALLIMAAVLAIAIGIAHSILGEKYILIRLFRRENLPKLRGSDWFTKRTLRFAWHITTLAWWGLAVVLLVAAAGERAVLHAVAATFLASAVVAGFGSRGRHYAWIVFLAIAALIWASMA